MGRMRATTRSVGSGSGKRTTHHDVKEKIDKPRTKRKKRKDLEELHRNVLQAKRNLRMQASQKKKRKTALGRVLQNFAEKRQKNDDKIHGFADKEGKKNKPRKICNRLLPETILGIYQNGAKGREVHRGEAENWQLDNINAARLRGDVLKLLNGDETNPKLPRNGSDKRAETVRDGKTLASDDSDCTSSNEGRSSHANNPVHNQTKGDKRTNGESNIQNSTDAKASVCSNNADENCFQKENKCKRRLFEPTEDDTETNFRDDAVNGKNSFVDEIRFSPSRDIDRSATRATDFFVKQHVRRSTDIEMKNDGPKKLMPGGGTIDGNFRGWSPTIYYERLCAMICAENFENNPMEQPSRSDPIAKIRRTLREIYRKACRYRASNRKGVIAKGNKHQEQNLAKVKFTTEDSSLPSTTEIQACTTDSELNGDSTDTEATKVLSVRRSRHFCEMFEPTVSTVLPDTIETTVDTRNRNDEIRFDERRPCTTTTMDEQNFTTKKTSKDVEKTINSVSLFLDKLRENNSSTDRGNIFQMEVESRVPSPNVYSKNLLFNNVHRDLTFDGNLGNLVKRGTKHVPTILRRSNGHCGSIKKKDEKRKKSSTMNSTMNVTKRNARTIATIKRSSSRDSDDSDHIETPRIVNHRAIIDKSRCNNLETNLNFIASNDKPRETLFSSENRECEIFSDNYGKHVINERKQLAREIFVNPVDTQVRDSYTTNYIKNDRNHVRRANNDVGQQQRTTIDVGFGPTKVDPNFHPSNFQLFDPASCREIRDYYRNSIHDHTDHRVENPPNPSQSFPFDIYDIAKNSQNRERQIFVDEMKKFVAQRISGENGEVPFVRPRYVPNERKCSLPASLSQSQRNSQTCESGCSKKMEFPSSRHVEPIPMYSNDYERTNDENSKTLSKVRANVSSYVATNNDATMHVQPRQCIGKPIVIFRPISEIRQRSEIVADSRYRLSDNGEKILNDAVTNFQILNFNDNNVNDHRDSQDRVNYSNDRYHTRCPTESTCIAKSHDHRNHSISTKTVSSTNRESLENRATKYLAFNNGDGSEPQRLPIYRNNDNTKHNDETVDRCNRDNDNSTFLQFFDNSNNCETMCVRCHNNFDDNVQRDCRRFVGRDNGQYRDSDCHRVSQVSVMLPSSDSMGRQMAVDQVAARCSTTKIVPTSVNDVSTIVYTMTDCDALVPAKMTYRVEPACRKTSRCGNDNHSKRVQLSDGRVGLLVTENCGIDNRERFASNGPTALINYDGINVENLNERNRSALNNDRIYY